MAYSAPAEMNTYTAKANTIGPPVEQTLTQKSNEVLGRSARVLSLARAIEQQLWPTPEKDGAEPKPDASALPWILEGTQDNLDRAIATLDRIAAKL